MAGPGAVSTIKHAGHSYSTASRDISTTYKMDNGWSAVKAQATFWESGDYVIDLRVENFSVPDSSLITSAVDLMLMYR